ncbi:phage tail protein [Allosphingosinicella sp.]|jgi:hypothetical protein|uniref:phage tail protein n=1 Tax=Allosphingosinicella sp. TaxID=2823234 RepID=UPI002EDC643F
MATLVLTAVGRAVGGPIGGAVGAIVGQRIDQEIFAPKAHHGPRLGELAVQTSSYGSAIPRIFGTMRVAGTVIWATDLIEHRRSDGGGKGRPKSIAYTYSANFAVAISARRLQTVKRIWADGKLLRGASGDFKSATRFRFYPGDEDQPVDALIASAEGAGQAPAFRGTAYALFEEFQLEDYGNRIPSLTFEVEADPGPIAIGAIAQEISGGSVVEGPTPSVAGYAASGSSVRGAIEALGDLVPLSLADSGSKLILISDTGPAVSIGRSERTKSLEILRGASGQVPGEVSIAYHDPARDFQTGLQRAVRFGPSTRSDRRSIAASLDAATAKGFAEHRLAAAWAARVSAKVEVVWRRLDIAPGAAVRIEGERGIWRVQRRTIGPMSATLELRKLTEETDEAADAVPGRSLSEADLVHGPTIIRLLDLPVFGESGRPMLIAVAAGESPGWRRAAVLVSFDSGESWNEAGPTAAPAVLGRAATALPPASSALFDESNSLEVELLHDEMWMEGRSDSALAGTANLALVGSELIQFGRVEPLGSRVFRLSRLLRGRRGTEWASAAHSVDEPFALIAPESAIPLDAPAGMIGSEAKVIALGVGDEAAGAEASLTIAGESLRPPSPVHLRGEWAGGDIVIAWVRRSRLGWSWESGGDAALGEEQERYRVTIAGAGSVRTAEVAQPSYVYTASEQALDGESAPLSISVVQIGTHAESRPANLIFD